MQNRERTTDIHWLNWAAMLQRAEEKGDETFNDIPKAIGVEIIKAGGDDVLKEWQIDEPFWFDDDRSVDRTVAFHVNNAVWDWSRMIRDMVRISQNYPEIIFLLRFQEGDVSDHTFLHGGKLTTVLFDTETNDLIECY